MPGINEDRERQVIPLWRSFDTTSRHGELASLSPASEGRFADEMLKELVVDWEMTPSIPVAADLVSAALTLGRFSVATKAAEAILAEEKAPAGARGLAEAYLKKGRATPNEACQFDPQHPADPSKSAVIADRLREEVRETRKRLIDYPRNPILWSNLGRLYTSLGQREKAERAMRLALGMAPENRFILRVTSRFYLHQGMKDHAHRLLASEPSVRVDPWILAAEIAVAKSIGRTSKHMKVAKRVLDVKKQRPFHLSELASAMGTIESMEGNLRAARPLITFSLKEATGNSVAQAAWLHRKVGRIGLESGGGTNSFEANAWFAIKAQRWRDAMIQAACWQVDQPFSSRPAIVGSHLAAVMIEDFDSAAAFAKQGLLSNPEDFALQNNLALALALRGDVVEAKRIIDRVDGSGLDEKDRVVLLATRGLVAFRSGDATAGRLYYLSAVALGKRLNDVRGKVARLYYAREELRIGSAEAEAIRKGALEGAADLTEPAYLVMVEKLKNY